MAKRMLIDATHPEETRVVVLDGNRLEEFDFETSTKKQVRGNIYLAKVTRVEPSLQAAFVEYGGNRHGFLAFSEIHPDYYRIPVADRRETEVGPQPPLEAAAEGAEESGVPLEDALPEPVIVVDTEPSPDEPNDSAAVVELGSAAAADETVRPHPEAEHRSGIAPEEETVIAPDEERASHDKSQAGEPARAGSPEAQPIADRSSQQPAPELDAEPAAAGPSPDRNSAAASARDEVLVAPEEPMIRVDVVASLGEISTHAEAHAPAGADHRAPEMVEGSSSRDAQHHDADTVGMPGPAGGEQYGDSVTGRASESDEQSGGLGITENGIDDAFERGLSSPEADGREVAEAHPSGNSENIETDPTRSLAAANGEAGESEIIETFGGDEFEEVETPHSRMHRQYKIQEVVRRRQIMLVQVTKEERGNKGAALTTYLSLAGRYCVLMPNTARGGGVSRKITNLSDRRRLKEILEELEIPEGMGVIVRTAGAERSKAEIKRDYEYLLRLWNEIRELTLRSTAPALIYEEGDLIKRSIRDLYTRDIDEVLVEGDAGYRTAKAFMKMLMPSHAKRVQPYRDPQIGLLHRFQVESQIDAIHSPVVQLRSGGYVVIDQTEALVAIDVNSGRATRERNIEETALRTNLEAAEEIARQLRLRDLAGLIVIDFIDMEEHRNQAAVERRLKESLRNDRARIQVGRISPFGLLEMSRQRLRSSLAEASTQPCPHCGGTGFIRSTESTALYVLRSIEEEGMRRRSAEVCVYVPTTVALYILNYKRESLAQLETRYGIHVLVARDDSLIPPAFRLDRLRAIEPSDAATGMAPLSQVPEFDENEADEDLDEIGEAEYAEHTARDGEEERVRARRRRRRRRRHDDERGRVPATASGEEAEEPAATRVAMSGLAAGDVETQGEEEIEAERLRRRRGRRGGRRRSRREDHLERSVDIGRPAADSIEIVAIDSSEPGEVPFNFGEHSAVAAPSELHLTEPGAASPADGIEAASLAALAGEGSAASSSAVSEPTALSPEIGFDQSPEPAGEETVGNGGNPPSDVAGTATSAEALAFARIGELQSEPDQPVAGSEPAHGTQPIAAEPSSSADGEAGEVIQQITKKPENPRRGWWQRLIQS